MLRLASATCLHILQRLLQYMRAYRQVVSALPGDGKEDKVAGRLKRGEGPIGQGSNDLVRFFEEEAPVQMGVAIRQQALQILLNVLRVLRLPGHERKAFDLARNQGANSHHGDTPCFW